MKKSERSDNFSVLREVLIYEQGEKTMKAQMTIKTIVYIALIIAGILMATANELAWVSARMILEPAYETGAVLLSF